jgi:hypothetical protein
LFFCSLLQLFYCYAMCLWSTALLYNFSGQVNFIVINFSGLAAAVRHNPRSQCRCHPLARRLPLSFVADTRSPLSSATPTRSPPASTRARRRRTHKLSVADMRAPPPTRARRRHTCPFPYRKVALLLHLSFLPRLIPLLHCCVQIQIVEWCGV